MLDPRLASRLANLQQHFLDQLSERMQKLEDALARIDSDADALKAARVLVHNLTGAGATFGCPEISEAARKMESSLSPQGSASAHLDPDKRRDILKMLDALKAAAHHTISRHQANAAATPTGPPSPQIFEEP